MIDKHTNKPIRVHGGGTAGPYFFVRVSQLTEVVAVLEKHKIYHWVDENAFSLDGEPMVTVVNFRRKMPAQQVQDLLDSVP